MPNFNKLRQSKAELLMIQQLFLDRLSGGGRGDFVV